MRRIGFPIPIAILLALILVATAMAGKPGANATASAEVVGLTIELTADPDRGTKADGIVVYLLPAGGHTIIRDADGDGIFEGVLRDDPRAEFARFVMYVGGKHKWQDIATVPIVR